MRSRKAILVVLFFMVPCDGFAQQGIDPGFDPDPVVIPVVAKTAPRPVTSMDLLKLRDIEGLQLSPDGKYIAFVLGQAVYETNHYRSGMFVIGTEAGSNPVNLGTAGPGRWDDLNEWLPENPVWSDDSRYIYHPMKINGSWQVWRWSREDGAPVQITHAPHDVESISMSPDGRSLVLRLQTPSKADRKKLYDEGILYDDNFYATGQSIIDHLVAAPGGESEMWIHELETGTIHKATTEEQKALEEEAKEEQAPDGHFHLASTVLTEKEIEEQTIIDFKISPDRKKLAYSRIEFDASKSDQRLGELLVRPAEGGPPVTLTHFAAYVEYWWSADGKDLYFTEDNGGDPNDARTSKIMVEPASGGQPHPALESSDFLRQFSTDRSKRLLAFIRENDSTPAEVAITNLATGQTRSLVEVNPELQNLEINRSQRIDVFDKSGHRYWGHLVLPLGYQAGKRYPLVITTYVDYGGFLRGAVGEEYPIRVFAANGFAVLNFDTTETQNFNPGDFESTLRQWQGPMEALEAMIEKLDGMGIIDRSRVAMTGLSHGADLTNYAISHTSLFRAAIASGDGWDPIGFYLLTDAMRGLLLKYFGLASPEGETGPNWQKVSLALNAARVHAPFLINTSDDEYLGALQLATAMRELKKPFEMFIYPDERHMKNQPRHRYSIFERNVDWLNFWLRDKEDPDPAKAEQYKRWRELRKLQEHDQSNAQTN